MRAKVKEILGVTPEQVVDYMALFGDSIDNIPGAKGIGEKGAAELILKYGTVENALDHADEVPNKRYREALQQQREQVMMSKQLARIAIDVPVTLELEKMKRQRAESGAADDAVSRAGIQFAAEGVGSGGGGCGDGERAGRGEDGLRAAGERRGISRVSGEVAGEGADGGLAESGAGRARGGGIWVARGVDRGFVEGGRRTIDLDG